METIKIFPAGNVQYRLFIEEWMEDGKVLTIIAIYPDTFDPYHQ